MAKFCAECGSPLEAIARYCGNCGASIQPSQPSSTYTYEPVAPASSSAPPHSGPNIWKRVAWGGAIAVAVIGGLAIWGAISEDEQRSAINAQNQAAELGEGASESRDDSSVFDLRVGDCVGESIGSGIEFSEIDTVPCSSRRAERKVVQLFTVRRTGTYPGVSYFDQQSMARCPASTLDYFYPTQESWAFGDRTVTCLAAP